jgi:hypothetical protein
VVPQLLPQHQDRFGIERNGRVDDFRHDPHPGRDSGDLRGGC